MTKDQYIARGRTVRKGLASNIAVKDNDKTIKSEETLLAPGDGSVANVKDVYVLVSDDSLLTKNDITDTNHVYDDLTEILPEGSVSLG